MVRNTGIEYPERGKMRFYDLGPPPDPGPTQILIQTRYSGITNGTERHALMAEHGWEHFPGRHGYQHVATVIAVGDSVKQFKPDDLVYFGQYVGHRGWHLVDVAHADLHSGASHLCIHLPAGVEPKQCALLGVAGVAMRGVRRFRVAPARNVWVAGLGPIGQFAAQAARAFGATVTVSDVDDRRLEVAQELGAHRVIDAKEGGGFEALKAKAPYDCMIDACGVESLLLEIHKHRLLAYKGVVGALAVRSQAVFQWSMLHMLEASIEVSCHYSLDDLRVVLHFLQRGDIRVEPLISHVVPIDEAPEIYGIMRDRPRDLLGVVFDWSD